MRAEAEMEKLGRQEHVFKADKTIQYFSIRILVLFFYFSTFLSIQTNVRLLV